MNASVFKEVHSLFLHDHDHHEHQIEHTEGCNQSTHIHEIEHVALDCSICDFNFSPSKELVSTLPSFFIVPISTVEYFYGENIFYQEAEVFPMLRAPPSILS